MPGNEELAITATLVEVGSDDDGDQPFLTLQDDQRRTIRIPISETHARVFGPALYLEDAITVTITVRKPKES